MIMKRIFIYSSLVLLAVACNNTPKEAFVDYSKYGGCLGNVEMVVENEYEAVFNGESYQKGQLLSWPLIVIYWQ